MQVYSLISNNLSDFYMFTPWSLDLFIRVPSRKGIQSCSHFGTLSLSYTLPFLSYQVLIFTWVKWSIWGLSALLKDTTSKQCPNIERGKTWYFSENPSPSGIRNRTAGSDNGKALRSNHCAMLHIICLIWDQKGPEPISIITMQPQENPCRILLGLHGNSTEGLFLKNLYCLQWTFTNLDV